MAAISSPRHISGILSTWFDWGGQKQAKTTYQGSPHNPRTCIDFTKTLLIHGLLISPIATQLPTVIISAKSDLPPGSSMETGRDLSIGVLFVGREICGI